MSLYESQFSYPDAFFFYGIQLHFDEAFGKQFGNLNTIVKNDYFIYTNQSLLSDFYDSPLFLNFFQEKCMYGEVDQSLDPPGITLAYLNCTTSNAPFVCQFYNPTTPPTTLPTTPPTTAKPKRKKCFEVKNSANKN